ncbi:MAG TPA: flavodoxin family protein [Ruminiclostridium sp.]
MKVLAINGSPHKDGCTYTAIRLMADELEKQNIEVEIVHVGNKLIRGCTACNACNKMAEKKCIFDDDIVNECVEKCKEVDGIIIGSPVYYSGVAGTMKSFLDRFFYSGANLQYKVGAAVVSLRRSGGVDSFHQLNNYFNLANVVITPSHYWNVIHGSNAGDVMQDGEGVQIMQNLGKNMAWLLKSLDSSKNEISLPQKEERVWTNFIR